MLLGNGVEFHSQFIQVCLPAIKTRQLALIFYTRRDSQKAITHKFLIMFSLLGSVITSSTRGDFLRPKKLFASFSSYLWTNMEEKVVYIFLVDWFSIFTSHITNKKRQIWFRTTDQADMGWYFSTGHDYRKQDFNGRTCDIKTGISRSWKVIIRLGG